MLDYYRCLLKWKFIGKVFGLRFSLLYGWIDGFFEDGVIGWKILVNLMLGCNYN